jgi:hypothetical protein
LVRARFVCAAFGGFSLGGCRFRCRSRFGRFCFFAVSGRFVSLRFGFALFFWVRFWFLGFGRFCCGRGRSCRCFPLCFGGRFRFFGFARFVVGFVGFCRFRRLVCGLSFCAFFAAFFCRSKSLCFLYLTQILLDFFIYF